MYFFGRDIYQLNVRILTYRSLSSCLFSWRLHRRHFDAHDVFVLLLPTQFLLLTRKTTTGIADYDGGSGQLQLTGALLVNLINLSI